MARPETHDDISQYHSRDVQVADFNEREITKGRNLRLITAMYEFLTAAEEAGMKVSSDYDRFTASRAKTSEELDALLEREQQDWDKMEARYQEAKDNPREWAAQEGNAFWVSHVDRHAEQEGHDPLQWEEE